jgi:hypothetical protein
VRDFLVEEIDAVGAADAKVSVAGEKEKAATVTELRDAAVVFTGGIEEKITAGIGIAAADVLKERRVHEIPLPDFGIEGSVVARRENVEAHGIFRSIVDGWLELDLRGHRGGFLADGFEKLARADSLEEAGGAVELWRGPERRGGIREREGEGDFFTAGERLPTDEKVRGAEGLVLNGEQDALISGIGRDGDAVECEGTGDELPKGLSLGFVFWSGGNGVGAVFGFDGFRLVVGDQSEIARRETTDLIARGKRERAIVDLVDGDFVWIGGGTPGGFAFDFIEECDRERGLSLSEE